MKQSELKKRRNIFLLVSGILLLFIVFTKMMNCSLSDYILSFFCDSFIIAEVSLAGIFVYAVLQFWFYAVANKKMEVGISTINKAMYLSFVVCIFPGMMFYGMSAWKNKIILLFAVVIMLVMVIFPFIKTERFEKNAFSCFKMFAMIWYIGIQIILRMESDVEVVKKIDIGTVFESDNILVYEENADSGVLGECVQYRSSFNKLDDDTYYFCYYNQVETPIAWLREAFKKKCLEDLKPELIWNDETTTVSYASEGWYVIESQDTVIVMETNAMAEAQKFLEIP